MDTGLSGKGVLGTGGAGGVGRPGSGALVMSGPSAGVCGGAGPSDYAAAKGAIVSGLLFSLKNEAARIGNGVRVNVVAPGWTATPMIGDKGLDAAPVARVTAPMPLKKLGM